MLAPLSAERNMSDPLPTFLTSPSGDMAPNLGRSFQPVVQAQITSPFVNYPLGITSVCQQTRHESSSSDRDGLSLWELTRQGDEQKYLDLISAVTVDFDARTMLEFLKDLLLALKDISETVPYSSEWWLATYQDRMSWLPRTPEQLSLDDAVRRFLGLREIPQRAPKSFIVSTWGTLPQTPQPQKTKVLL
jgi:hypothetical protein